MRDEERRAALHRRVHRGNDLVLGARIDRRRGIVEQKNRRLQQQRARDGETLLLSAGKSDARLAENRVVALRQGRHEIVRGGDARRLFDLLARGIGMAERDVCRDGRAEQKALLKNEADVAAQLIEIEIAGVHTVDEHAPGGRIVETRDEAHQRAFSAARRADDGDALAGLHLEVDVLQNGIAPVIEPDFFKPHAPPEARQARGTLRRLDLHRCVEHVEDAARGAQALLHGVRDVADAGDLPRELLQDRRETDQPGADADLAAHRQPAAVAEQHDDVCLRQKKDHRHECGHAPENPVLLVAQRVIRLFEPRDLVRFARERLDDLHAADALREPLHHVVVEFARPLVGRPHHTREAHRHRPEERRCREAREREPHMDREHVGEERRDRRDQDDDLKQHAVHEQPHRLHVAADAVDERAAGVRIEKSEREALEFVVNLRAQIDDEFPLEQLGEPRGVEIAEQHPRGGEREHRQRDHADDPHRRPVRGRCDAERPLRGARQRVECVAYFVDAEAGEADAEQSRDEQRDLDGDHLHAIAAIPPRHRQQAARERPVRGFGFG